MQGNRILNSDRVAVSNFGSAIDIRDSELFCATFDIQSEEIEGTKATFGDLEGTECGCDPSDPPPRECIIDSSAIAPPKPVGGLE